VDVYDDTPTIVTIWLTIMPKISILILLLELYTHIDFINGLNSVTITTNGYIDYLYSNISLNSSINPEGYDNNLFMLSPLNIVKGIFVENMVTILTHLLLISSLLSLIIGSIVGLAQVRIKRLLAYSTISHIGFILLALAINTEQSIDSLLFYIIQYSITNLNIFLIIIALGYIITNIKNNLKLTDIKYISEFKHHFFVNPLISVSLTICLFSMAGIIEVC
jgi:NADH-ubiquinone oxidoreductase chain 2